MSIDEFSDKIKFVFRENLDINLNDEQVDLFFCYMNYLISENSKYNLTAIVEPNAIIYKHFLDSCFLLKFSQFVISDKSVIDIGCGAGFPSLPLAILCPNNKFLLIDSVGKKISFISKFISKYNLSNVFTLHTRAEDISKLVQYREKYDYCLFRAVSSLSVLLEYASPFLVLNGKMFSYKNFSTSVEFNHSLNCQKFFSMKFFNSFKYSICNSDRIIYCYNKIAVCPSKFPRKAGLALKNPY